ncbi:carboxylesterase/lipase family protein [Granulicella sp. dw_53]|uniref:carboxylesterase/lipase family protein n=1 Tax=Granulicella sp. dw_53 TaxID=2719792 RepID=UPI001BD2098B|nr:carboxylesterase/lipase family protein [Granulicella sp. dw_53]
MANSRHGGSEGSNQNGSGALSRRRFLQQSSATLAALALSPSALLADPTLSTVVVSTPSGKLRGESSKGIRIFRGVPFAQPPVGSLRFRPTAPLKPWKDIRDATTFAPAAMQPYEPFLPQSEDCLYLNIWAPPGRGPFPVFVWIHGGGFTGGHSFASLFDGTNFALENIVLVSVAYRLGVFGFMDLGPLLGPSYAGSGNNALHDLVASLQWVHDNIGAFGGDPDRVTVGGESAGAKATAALMALPQSRNLFQSAISQSGGGERVLSLDQAAKVASDYGNLWRTAHPSPNPGFEDLRTASPVSLIATEARLISTSDRHFRFRSETGDSFLPQRPVDLISAASSTGKRLLIGTNRDESALFLGPHPTSDPTSRDLGNLDLPHFNEVFAKYKTVYPDMPEDQLRVRAVTAEEYWVPSIRLADAHSRTGGSTWMYRLDYTKPTGRQMGEAFHSIDLSLVWQQLDQIEVADPTAAPLSKQIHQAWVAFIRGNAPAARGLPQWPQYDPTTRSTMILAPDSHVEEKPFDAELQLWDEFR